MAYQKREIKLEQYFTPPETSKKCVELIEKHWDLHKFDRIIEPSAGAGSFLRFLPRYEAYDILPLSSVVQQADFLTLNFTRGVNICVGNPPFGARGGMAMKFLNKCCEFSDVVAFILPRSFRKYTLQNSINKWFHLKDEFNCDDFETPSGGKVKIKCVFQIWERRDYERHKEGREETPEFKMKHYHLSRCSEADFLDIRENFDFAIAQVGANFLPRDILGLTKGSYWFIKGGDRGVFEKCDYSFLDEMNTTFKSLSKNDIIKAYNLASKKTKSETADAK